MSVELTPLDILSATFKKRLHGYDPEQVQAFLAQVASALEELAKEKGRLKQEVDRLEAQLEEYREREKALNEALVGAQKAAEGTVEAARSEAERIVAAAKAEGTRIVQEAQALAQKVVDEAVERVKNLEVVIGDLRNKRREVRGELMKLVELLQGVIRDDQRAEAEEKATATLSILDRRKTSRSGS